MHTYDDGDPRGQSLTAHTEPDHEPAANADSDNPLTRDFEQELLRPHPTGAAAARKPPSVPLAPLKRVQARFNPLADVMVYLVVFIGGCFGTALRYGLWLWLPYRGTTNQLMAFHPATFIANMIATFVFALLSSYMTQAIWIRKRARQLISRGVGMGMCGGFSTLSAMMIEDITAMHNGGYWGFFLYTMVTFIVGIAVAWFGSWLGLQLTKKRSAKQAVAEALRMQTRAKPAIGVRVPTDPEVAGAHTTDSNDELQSASLAALAATTHTGDPDPDTDEIPVVADPMTGEVK